MTTTVEPDTLLTTKEAATLLGLKPNTLEIWRSLGKGPAFLKYGDEAFSAVRYERSTLLEWLKTRRFSSTSAHTAAVRERQTA
jgi:hypothetical protein